MQKVTVPVSEPYEVLIGEGLITAADQHLSSFLTDKKVMIVTDENVDHYRYPEKLKKAVHSSVISVEQITLPAGEAQKSLENVSRLVRILAEKQFSRNDILIALGGGVIGDLVGFVASIYLRGIDFIQIPTTLLAAIDSSVGGKTAVDLPEGKNLVGAFYHPKVVLCDTSAFKTLPRNIFEDGCSELIKYGMIMNPDLLSQLMNRSRPLEAESEDLDDIVHACVQMKTDIVVEDEKDKGLRQLLNYGHTLGHALEQVSGYELSHGRAIAIGQSFMLRLAVQGKYIGEDFTAEFDRLLLDYHLLDEKPSYDFESIQNAMLNDKKRQSKSITLVIPTAFGKCELFSFPIETFLNWFNEGWKNYEISN